MSEKLIQEIKAIDRDAEDMAESVFKNPLLRSELEKKSEILEDRLLSLVKELEGTDPAACKMMADQISESLLDLAFVQMDSDMVSLRLGQVIEQERLRGQDKAKGIFTEQAESPEGLDRQISKDADQNDEALKELLNILKEPD